MEIKVDHDCVLEYLRSKYSGKYVAYLGYLDEDQYDEDGLVEFYDRVVNLVGKDIWHEYMIYDHISFVCDTYEEAKKYFDMFPGENSPFCGVFGLDLNGSGEFKSIDLNYSEEEYFEWGDFILDCEGSSDLN